MRINKYLAECGVASRRKSEEYVLSGRVQINGRKITDLATDVEEDDKVTLDDKRVTRINKHLYLMLHKPKGYVSTASDDKGRKTVLDLVKNDFPNARLFPIGRLDYDTEGLLLLTTDGDLCQRISHPSNEIDKVYSAKINGEVSEFELNKLRNGVEIDGHMTKKCKIKFRSYDSKTRQSRIDISIREGLNRQIRKMFETIGKEVLFLKRVSIGDLKLGGVSRSKYRILSDGEINYLQRL